VTNCERCSTLVAEQPREEHRILAPLLTPGASLLAEREYELARQALLSVPETVSPGQLELAETSHSSLARWRDGRVPAKVGSYQLRYELGRGAMGVVYRARHTNLKRDVALKILHPHLTTEPRIVQRFYGEMEAIGQLRDPHIVQAHDAGESDGVHFLAMEYVDGANAGQLCAHAERLSVPNACEIIYQVALGLATAERHKIVHRDIKPSNLIVGRGGQVKILDFGLASFRQEGLEHLVEDDAVGTVDYMAPEQWKGSPRIDIRADIYSLGCTMVKLLAGHPPFYRAPHDGVSKMQAHLYQPAPPLRELRRDVPRELETLVARLLAKTPSDRITDPHQIAETLERYREGSDLAALVEQCVPPTSDDLGKIQEVRPSKGVSISRRRTRRKWLFGALAVSTALVVILATSMVRVMDDGALVVTVDQPGALIQVGSSSFTTHDPSQPVTIPLDRGRHEVTVSKDGFEVHQETVAVGRGGEAALSITLKPQFAPETSPIVLAGHKGPLTAVDISADGKWILTGSLDRTARLWDAETGQELLQLVGHEDAVLDVVFTPDGRYAVSGSKDRTARIWDLASGAALHCLTGFRDSVSCVAVSENGDRLLTGCIDAYIRLWDLHSGQRLANLGAHRSWVRDVAFLPGSHEAVSCSNDRMIILWDLETGRMRKVLQGHIQPMTSISAAEDGRHVVTSSEDTTIRLWNLDTEQPVQIMRSHVAPVRSVQFVAGSNYVVSSSDDRDVRLWNPFRGECLAEFSGHDGEVNDVDVHLSAGLLATASSDRTARVYKLGPLPDNPSPDDLVQTTAEPLNDNTLISVEPLQRWSAGEKGVQTVAVTPNGKRIATGGGDDRVIRIWDTESGALVRELTEPTDGILCTQFSPNGQWLAAGGKDQHIYLWDMSTEAAAKTLNGHSGWVMSLEFSSTGERLLSGAFDATMRLWDVTSGAAITMFPGQIEWIRAAAFGGNKSQPLIISAGHAGCLRLWQSGQGPDGEVIGFRPLEMPYQSGQISSIAVSTDGELVAAAGWNRPLQVWNTASGNKVAEFGDPNLTIYDLAWYGADGQLLAACADGSLRLWDTRERKEVKRYVGHTDAVRSVSISADLQVIVSGSQDGTICHWPHDGLPLDDG
jgi:WD40 repeat protein/serine/threonine protein kinase